jgi:MFS family permease
MLGVGAILMVVVQARSLEPPVVISLFAVGIVALALLVVCERRAAEPVVPFRMWRSRVMAIGNIGSLILGALLMCVVVFLPTYIQGVMAHSATVAGAIVATQSVSWSVGSIIFGRMTRTSYRTSGVTGALALIVGTSLLVALNQDSGLPYLAFAAVLVGLGMGFCNQTFLVAIQSSVGWNDRGVATASILFLRTIGQTLGASLGGAILNFGVAHLFTVSDQPLNQLLDPAKRANLDAEAVLRVIAAIAASLHDVYIIAAVLAVLTLAVTLMIPAGISAARAP